MAELCSQLESARDEAAKAAADGRELRSMLAQVRICYFISTELERSLHEEATVARKSYFIST